MNKIKREIKLISKKLFLKYVAPTVFFFFFLINTIQKNIHLLFDTRYLMRRIGLIIYRKLNC